MRKKVRNKIVRCLIILFIAILTIIIAIQITNASNVVEYNTIDNNDTIKIESSGNIESSDNIDVKQNIMDWYVELTSLPQDNLFDKEAIIIRYEPDASPIDISNLENKYNLVNKKELTNDDLEIYCYDLPGSDEISLGLIKEINDFSFVKYAEPNYSCSSLTDSIDLKNDPDFNTLWGLNNQIYPGIDIDVENAWRTTKGDPSVIVAVIDSGIDYNHPELKDNIWLNKKEIPNNGIDDDKDGYIDDIIGWNFNNNNNNPMDGFNHGTHVAGTIGAIDNKGMSGVAPDVTLMPLKIFANDGGLSDSYTIISAITFAHEHGASIVNMSFGSRGMSQSLYDVMSKYDDMLFVSAAGNNGSDIDFVDFFPACFILPNNISVASIDQNGDLSSFSNYGVTQVDVAAPGREIYSTLPNNKLGYMSGTSMAAPHVSGVAALVKSDNMNLTPAQIKQIILSTEKPLPSLEGKTAVGGLVNAEKALASDDTGMFNLMPNPIPTLTNTPVISIYEYESIKDVFSDSVLANEVARQLKKSVNDDFTLDDVKKITSIDIQSGVNSAKGIERLINLSTLKLIHGGLTSIDLSKNVNLTTLELEYNKITSIDLSSNVKLQSLILYSNKISELDLTKNIALTFINLGYNQLTNLDLSKNINGDQIYAENNKLSIVNFDNANNYRIIFLSNNNLTSLDLTNQKSLIYYRLSNNPFITNGLKLPSQKLINYP